MTSSVSTALTGAELWKTTLRSLDSSDVHCATPNRSGTRLLVANTGREEILEIDWAGNIYWQLSLGTLFDLPESPDVLDAIANSPDSRLIRFDHQREFFHVNWVEWVEEGSRALISCHAPGLVAEIGPSAAAWKVLRTWSYYPHCHGPDSRRGTGWPAHRRFEGERSPGDRGGNWPNAMDGLWYWIQQACGCDDFDARDGNRLQRKAPCGARSSIRWRRLVVCPSR